MNQVEHLLKLADEYEARGIVDVCVKLLQSEAQSKDNAVKILHLATCTPTVREDERLTLVRGQCYEVTKNMELTETQGKESYKNLEKFVMERVLVKRIQRLEKFVKEIYPQFMGLVEWCLWHVLENAEVISTCPQHFLNKKPIGNLLGLMKGCSVCRQMIKQMILHLKTSQQTQPKQKTQQSQEKLPFSFTSPSTAPFQFGAGFGSGFGSVPATTESKYGGNRLLDEKMIWAGPATTESKYGGNRLLDEKVITIIHDFDKILTSY